MIFRLSQNLTTKLKAGAPVAIPMDANPFADWSARSFAVGRAQYILLSNTASLYSTVSYVRGILSAHHFIVRAMSSIREVMEADGQAIAYERFIVPATGSVGFAKTLNRSVTGSMTDLVKLAKSWLFEGDLSPHDVSFKLNEVPMSAIPGRSGLSRHAERCIRGTSGPSRLGPAIWA